jgi:hypothetical protein
MNKKFLILIFSISIFLVLYSTPVVMAGHSTCIDGKDAGYCGATMDWQYIFSNMDSPETSDLNDAGSNKYRNMYQGINTIFDQNTESALTGERMPVEEEEYDNPYRGGSYGESIGYPEYRYEIHGWGSDSIKIDDGETTKEVIQEIYQPSWSYSDEKSVNKFKVDSAITTVTVPQGTKIKVNLYDEPDREDKVATATYTPDDSRRSADKLSRTTQVEFEGGEEYSPVYYVEAVLERDDTSTKSPVLGNNTVLKRDLPEFRSSSTPYSKFPGETLSEYNEFMAQEYEDSYGSSNEDSYSPRILGFASGETSNGDFDTDTNVFHNAFSEITYVDKSFRVSDNYESLDEVNFAEHMITKEGTIHINYDAAVSATPNEGDWIYDDGVDEDDPDDGDKRLKYDRDDIDYEVEVGYEYRPGIDLIKSEIETFEEEDSGHVAVDYDEDDYTDDIESFYSEINAESRYSIEHEKYDIETEPCPPNNSPMDEDYDEWVSEDDCDDPDDEYVESESWEDNDEDDLTECLEVGLGSELITNDPSCNEITTDESSESRISRYLVMDTSETYSISEESFDTYTAYMPENVETRFHKEEGKIWTNLESKQYSIQETIFVSDDSYVDTINIPRVRSIPEDTGAETYDINGEEYTVEGQDYQAIEGEIEGHNVYLDVYTTGPLTPDNELSVSVEGNEVYTGNIDYDMESNLKFKTVGENIEITDEINGEGTVDVKFNKGGDGDRETRFDYVIKIETDKSINKLNSRWRYATFRDSRWDHIYRYSNECTSELCTKYGSHGHYIADDGERKIPDNAELPPEDLRYFYPSKSVPVRAYLIPTSTSIETRTSSGYQEDITVKPETSINEAYSSEYESSDSFYPDSDVFYLDEDNPEGSIDDLGSGIKAGVYEGKIYSDSCPRMHNSEDEDSLENQYCGFTESHAADIYNEINIHAETSSYDISSIDLESYVEALEEAEEQDIPEDEEEDIVEGVNAFNSPYNYADLSPLDYSHLNSGTRLGADRDTSTSKRYYPEYTKFTIETSGSSSWQLSGRSPWSEKNLSNEDQYIFDNVDFNIVRVDDLSEHFESRDYSKADLKDEDTRHDFIDDSEYSSIPSEEITQLRIQVSDQHGRPVNFRARKSSSYDIRDYITIEDGSHMGSGAWGNGEYTPNENGVIYKVLPTGDEGEDPKIKFEGDQNEWWNVDSDARLLKSEESENIAVEYSEDDNGSESSSSFPWLFIVFSIYAVAFMGAALLKSTNSDISAVDILKIPVELFNPSAKGIPGSGLLLKFIQLFILITAILAVSPGTQNPLGLFEPVANFFGQVISQLLF